VIKHKKQAFKVWQSFKEYMKHLSMKAKKTEAKDSENSKFFLPQA
jgi:hypothetical protein